MKSALTQAILRQQLEYEPISGIFRWKVSKPRTTIGGIAGGLDKGGYRRITVHWETHFAHRLAFLYMKGYWPKQHVDHRDQNPDNNAWSNLREATVSQNRLNRGCSSTSRSGIKNIYKLKERWTAHLSLNRKTIFHFSSRDLEEVKQALAEARIKFHGDFARSD